MNVILRCHVTSLSTGQFIRWSKVVTVDGSPVFYNIATNGQMETGFNQPDSRYKADFEVTGSNDVEFRLYISREYNAIITLVTMLFYRILAVTECYLK